jgi:uncharacterized membrane protein (Fun14 family)
VIAELSCRRIAGVVVGSGFIFLQSLAYSGYIQVDWQKIERGYKSMLNVDEDGEVRLCTYHSALTCRCY